eukprot:scaffold27212_cov91-Isochrysis_galbana.AAC.1
MGYTGDLAALFEIPLGWLRLGIPTPPSPPLASATGAAAGEPRDGRADPERGGRRRAHLDQQPDQTRASGPAGGRASGIGGGRGWNQSLYLGPSPRQTQADPELARRRRPLRGRRAAGRDQPAAAGPAPPPRPGRAPRRY